MPMRSKTLGASAYQVLLLLLLLPLILSETQHNTSLSSKHVNLVHCASFE